MLCVRLLYAIVHRQLFMMCVRARARECVIHWHCSAQLSMFNMEKRYRNKIIIIIIINKRRGGGGMGWGEGGGVGR